MRHRGLGTGENSVADASPLNRLSAIRFLSRESDVVILAICLRHTLRANGPRSARQTLLLQTTNVPPETRPEPVPDRCIS